MTPKEIKIGQMVEWKCRPYQDKPFIARGIVIEIGKSKTGSKKKMVVAKIRTMGEYANYFPYRKTTTVGVDKLELTKGI